MLLPVLLLALFTLKVSNAVAAPAEVRLSQGFSPTLGRLEVLVNGSWATVCRSPFDVLVPTIACREAGLGEAGIAYPEERFGQGGGPLWLHGISCRGTEPGLSDCRLGPANDTACLPGNATSIACSGGVAKDSTTVPASAGVIKGLRLVGGTTEECGLVQVLVNGTYGGVCTTGFDDSAARVVCKQLGLEYESTEPYPQHYGYNSDMLPPGNEEHPITWMDQLACKGDEPSLDYCACQGCWNATECLGQVSLFCYNATKLAANPDRRNCTVDAWRGLKIEGARLANGTAPTTGILEVRINDTWGAVCAYGPTGDSRAASVACRELGLGAYGFPHTNTLSRADFPRVWVDNVTCVGEEKELQSCDLDRVGWASSGYRNCGLQTITCINSSTDPGNPQLPPQIEGLRLINGTTASNGFLEVNVNGKWGAVDNKGFPPTAQLVACRQLGFAGAAANRAGGSAISSSYISIYAPELRNRWNVSCSGAEGRLADCKFNEELDGLSYYFDPAFILCRPPGGWQLEDVKLVNGTSGATIVRSRGGAAASTSNASELVGRGRLEIWSDRMWGNLSNATFGQKEAVVACRTLGFSDPIKASLYELESPYPGYYSASGSPQWVKAVSCTGGEVKLRLCNVTWCNDSCPVGGPVGVQCM